MPPDPGGLDLVLPPCAPQDWNRPQRSVQRGVEAGAQGAAPHLVREDPIGPKKYMWSLAQRPLVAQTLIKGCRYPKAHWHLLQDTLEGMDERAIDTHLYHCRNVFEENKGMWKPTPLCNPSSWSGPTSSRDHGPRHGQDSGWVSKPSIRQGRSPKTPCATPAASPDTLPNGVPPGPPGAKAGQGFSRGREYGRGPPPQQHERPQQVQQVAAVTFMEHW